MAVIVKSPGEIAAMRRAGSVVASILKTLSKEIKAGVTTSYLDDIAVSELARYGAVSSFKGYRGFPATLCVSINEEIVHGIPDERKIREGDIVSLDFGAKVDGFHGDAALTVGVGNINPQTKQLLQVTKSCLEAGISFARAGAHLGDISAAIQHYAEWILDFNQAYSPWCAYSEAYTCPFVPSENWLEVPIQAGEKNYPLREGL